MCTDFFLIQIMTLVKSKPVPFKRWSAPSLFGDRTLNVHLFPLPSDDGCSAHFGHAQTAFHHSLFGDLKKVAMHLNKNLPLSTIAEQSPAEVSNPRFSHRASGQQDNYEVQWKELPVSLPVSSRAGVDITLDLCDAECYGLRFQPAVPSAEFESQNKPQTSLTPAEMKYGQHFSSMNKSQKKRAKLRAKRFGAAAVAREPVALLKPSDIARVRLFLCSDADVKDGALPKVHTEVDPRVPLAESVANFEKKLR
jgi:hypothetical protein